MTQSHDIFDVLIESFSHDGRGIVSINEKVVFVQNALPGEKVQIKITRKHRRYNEAETLQIYHPSPERVTPPCPHAHLCGGCSLQHLNTDAQLTFHEHTVKDLLKRTGHLTPNNWLPPLSSESTIGYRRKARLGVRYVRKKEKLLVGFREKQSNYLADLSACLVLDPRIGLKFNELASLIHSLDQYESIPQIEVAASDTDVALIFRHMLPLSANDTEKLIEFAKIHHIHIYLQPSTPESVHKIWPQDDQPWLSYTLPAYNLELRFHPTDFTQINHNANQQMIAQALTLLNPQPTDHVLDLFCGLGNFTLPIAQRAGSVVGVEGSLDMVKRGRENATLNQLNNIDFFAANLMEPDLSAAWLQRTYNSVLLDPPRTGAREILPIIGKIAPQRIVYISCNPATLARDAAILVNEQQYDLV